MIRGFAALTAACMLAACSSVVSSVGFPAADADDNDMLTQAEFNEFFDDTDHYERIDDNDDGMLNRTEYQEAVDASYEGDAYFNGLDRDRSGSLSRDEFLTGWFGMFDSNKNGQLTDDEFEAAISALEAEL